MHKEKIAILIRRFEALRNREENFYLEEAVFEQIIAYYTHRDDYENALVAANFACRNHPYSAELCLLKAQLHTELHEFRKSLAMAQNAENLGLRTVELYTLKAEAALGIGDKKEAQNALHTALDRANDDDEFAAIYVGISNIYEQQNEYSKVIDTLRLALQHNVNDGESLARIAHAAEQTARQDDALTIFQAVADTNPYLANAWFYVGKMNYSLGNILEAVDAYEYAIAINESFIDAYCALAEMYFEEGLYEKAIELLHTANAESPEPNAEIQYLLGFNHEQINAIGKAKAFYTEAIKINQAHHQARFALGTLFVKDRNWQAATWQFEKCTQLHRLIPEYWFAAADAYAQVENIEQACANFQNGLKHTQHSDFWLTYITYLLANNIAAEALTVLEEADVICMPHPHFQYAKVAALLLLKKRKTALQFLHAALARYPTEKYFLLDIFPELVKDYEVLRLLKQE